MSLESERRGEASRAVRHATKQYLHIVGSRRRLTRFAAGSAQRNPDAPFVGDGLFGWWDDLVNPSHPDIVEIFTERELESIRRFDTVIRGFHQTCAERELPMQAFIRTKKFTEISTAARACYRVFRRFWFFTVA